MQPFSRQGSIETVVGSYSNQARKSSELVDHSLKNYERDFTSTTPNTSVYGIQQASPLLTYKNSLAEKKSPYLRNFHPSNLMEAFILYADRPYNPQPSLSLGHHTTVVSTAILWYQQQYCGINSNLVYLTC